MAKITTVEGIGSSYAARLEAAGVNNTETLLERGASASGRKELAGQSGIGEKVILRWVNMCDLFRIKGVGEEYADLLEAAGVDTVPELAQRNAENLLIKMVDVNNEKKLVRSVPSADKVTDWIMQAKHLPKLISH